MKKQNWILFIIVLLFVSATYVQQNVYNYKVRARGGISIGPDTQSGTNTVLLDTVAEIQTNEIMAFSAGDSMNYYVPYAFRSTETPLLLEIEENAQTGTSYTLVLGDSGKRITLTNASAITLTVPPNSSVAFPVGSQIIIEQWGAGVVTVAEGSGVTINSFGSALDLQGQYATAYLVKDATDVWILSGAIE